MDIQRYFPDFDLTDDQYNALEALVSFYESNKQVFILKGFAGTGKRLC